MKDMKKIQRYVGSLMLLALVAVGFSACESDETIEERLFGRVWSGDIGLSAMNGEPVYSDFQFFPDGSGTENMYYQYGGRWYQNNPFHWSWDLSQGRSLILDYGNGYVSYMDNVYVGGGAMSGIYYNDDYSDGFSFRLQMK
jgi:hypothetical protein